MLMCLKHWRMVPKIMQDDIWRAYRPGQEIDKRPSQEYVKAQQRAIAVVVIVESGVTLELAIKILEKQFPLKGENMKVTEAKFTRRYNVAQYEHEEYTLTAVVEDEETGVEVLSLLKAEVEAAAGEESATGKAGKKKKPKKGKSSTEESSEEETGEDDTETEDSETDSTSEEDETEEETEDDSTEEEESEEDEADEGEESEEDESEEEEEKKPAKKASKKSPAKKSAGTTSGGSSQPKSKGKDGKKNFKKKPQAYVRANEAHKDIFSTVLKTVAPKWKSSFESKALAKKVSQQLEGKEFLDEDGKVLSSFKELVKKKMAGKK